MTIRLSETNEIMKMIGILIILFASSVGSLHLARRCVSPRKMLVSMSSDSVATQLSNLESEIFTKLDTKLKLKCTDFASFKDVSTWKATAASGTGYEGKIDWYEEKLGTLLTGVARYSSNIPDKGDMQFNIDGWFGPTRMVPHLTLSFGHSSVSQGFVEVNFIPRGAAPLGSDQSYYETYYGTHVQQKLYDAAMHIQGARHRFVRSNANGRLLRSPSYLSVENLPAADLAAVVNNHVDTWLEWLEKSTVVDSRLRGAFNTRDDKIRQFYYSSKLDMYQNQLQLQDDGTGDLLRRLAAGSTGPLAEAYVGGGS